MNSSKNIISQFYESENLNSYKYTRFTIRCPIHSLAMFDALAERFGVSRTDLIYKVMEDSAFSMFSSLEKKDLKNIALKADSIATDLYTKHNSNLESGFWKELAPLISSGKK